MATDATKKYREFIAFGLLAVGGLWFVGALSVLFKNTDLGFAEKSVAVGVLFESPVPVVSLVVAALIVTRLGGEPSPSARVVVLIALCISGLNLLFGVITFFAQFDSNQVAGFVGIGLAGKTVGALIGLALLIFLSVAFFYLWTAFQSLPAAVPVAQGQWGPDRGYAQYGPGAPAPGGRMPGGPVPGGPVPGGPVPGGPQGDQPGWGAPDPRYGPGGQPTWGQQPTAYGWGTPDQAQQAGWAAPAAGHAASQQWPQPWSQPMQPSPPPPAQQASWASPEAAAAASAWSQPTRTEQPGAGAWGESGPSDATWGQPEPAADQPEPVEDPVSDDRPEERADRDEVFDQTAPAAPAEPDDAADDTLSTESGWWQHPQR